MTELDERVANLEASSEKTEGRVRALEHHVSLLQMHCASKNDLVEAKAEILVKLAESESALKTEINTSETKLRTEISASECKLRTEISAVEYRLLAEIDGAENRLTTGINSVRDGLRTEISQAKNWLIFGVVGSVILAQYLPTMLRKLGIG